MQKVLKFTLLAGLIIALSCSLFSQTPQEIEKELVKNLNEVEKYSNYGGNYDGDKLTAANSVFEKNLLKYTKLPATLSYNFPLLKKMMMNATSDDGRFRVYTWDSEAGGTMHEYYRVYQYLGADGKVYSKLEDNSLEDGGVGSFVLDIFAVDTKGGKVYIVCSNFIGSNVDHYQSADLYKIEGKKIKEKVKLIKTASGLTHSLSFNYNFFSVADRKERPIRLIKFDKRTKTLSIPVVIEDNEYGNGRVTDKFINYRFNGTYFVKVN